MGFMGSFSCSFYLENLLRKKKKGIKTKAAQLGTPLDEKFQGPWV